MVLDRYGSDDSSTGRACSPRSTDASMVTHHPEGRVSVLRCLNTVERSARRVVRRSGQGIALVGNHKGGML
jgi:ABC-type histidine transport system ATPase subunit